MGKPRFTSPLFSYLSRSDEEICIWRSRFECCGGDESGRYDLSRDYCCFPRLMILDFQQSMMTTTEEHYVQGGLDYQFVEKTYDQRLECSICLLCLRNPHQTSCGHRFCYSCILTWLNEGKSCPHDNASLGEGNDDISVLYFYHLTI